MVDTLNQNSAQQSQQLSIWEQISKWENFGYAPCIIPDIISLGITHVKFRFPFTHIDRDAQSGRDGDW